jgi:hypothetical protein
VADQVQLVTVFKGRPRESDVTKDDEGNPKPPICPWSLQKDDGQNTKVKLQSYKMKTPNGSVVFVSVPKYDDKTVEKRYRYDCHTYALNCYEKFGYTVEAGSLWDVLHDPSLATTIGENLKTPIIPGCSGKLDLEEGKKPETMGSFLETCFDKPGLQPTTNDIMVFWEFLQIPENTGPWYIRASHSLILETVVTRDHPYEIEEGDPRYIQGTYLEHRYTEARTKNGSDKPKEELLRQIINEYDTYWVIREGPVGIYRLVGHHGESSLMNERHANSCNRGLLNSGVAGQSCSSGQMLRRI